MPSPTDPPVQQQCRQTTGGARNSAVYLPSTFLLCALIVWTAISAISEVFILIDAIFFFFFTYAPTFYFATKLMARRTVEGVQTSDTRKASRRVKLLTVSWVLNVGIHVGLWWVYRSEVVSGLFLLPTFSGSQAILLMISIAFRYSVDVFMTKREQKLEVPQDEAETSIETAALTQPVEPGPTTNNGNVPPQQEASEPATEFAAITSASSLAVPLYQPSIPLLLISLSLLLCAIVLDFQDYFKPSTPVVAIIALILAYIPTILLHNYIILQILQRNTTETLQHNTKIAGLSFDLVPLWLGTKGLVACLKYFQPQDGVVPPVHMVPGGVEILLIAYLAVRYTRSIYTERRRQIEMGIMEVDLPPLTNDLEILLSAAQPTDYHPSLILLIISIILSAACLTIESLAEPICGIPMSLIVYVPTIVVHLHLIYQQQHPSLNTTTPTQKFNKALLRSMQLCLVWVLTQAFYVFIWPISQHLKREVMNPWVRWPEVVLTVYITARYVRDRQVRNSVGSIRLPPDIEAGDSSAVEPSAVDASQ